MSEIPQPSIPEVAERLAQQYPSSLIAGSLGRAAIMHSSFDAFKPDSTKRDIDIFRFGERVEELPTTESGIRIDTSFESWIKIEPNGTWLVFPYNETIAVEVAHAEDIFAPQEVSISDSIIRVPLPQTLGAISTMQYIQRPKDIESMRIYNSFLETRESTHELPLDFFQPFEDFRNELARRKGYATVPYLRDAYHAVVPERVRKDDRMRWVAAKVRISLSKI